MKDTTKRTLRTSVQFVVGLAAALPFIVDTSGIPETAPGVGIGLAAAATLTRVMAVPAVQRLLPGWLRTDDGGRE
jgi:hypothetical protein